MACILKPECNFLHGYFRCLLPLETVNVEVKVKKMRGIHMFRRDRTTQVISCNPWSTKFHPYLSLIRKMKTYLELEGKLGSKPKPKPQSKLHTSTPSHDRNSSTRKTLVPMKVEEKMRARAPVKRRYKVRVIAQPMPVIPNFTHEPNSACCTYSYSSHFYHNSPNANGESAATSIPVTVYNLVQGKFEGILYPTGRL